MWDVGAREEEVHKSLKQLTEPALLISISQINCCTPGEVCLSGRRGILHHVQHHVPVLSASTWSTAPAMHCAGIKRFRVEKLGKY